MGVWTSCGVICISCCFLIVPFVFQTVGCRFFTHMWASNVTCDSIGLVYSCCAGSERDTCGNTNGVNELDVRALGLHATSFAMMFLAVFCTCCGTCCEDKDDDDDISERCTEIGGFCSLLYPLAGSDLS